MATFSVAPWDYGRAYIPLAGGFFSILVASALVGFLLGTRAVAQRPTIVILAAFLITMAFLVVVIATGLAVRMPFDPSYVVAAQMVALPLAILVAQSAYRKARRRPSSTT